MISSLRGKIIAFSGPFAMNTGKREAIAQAIRLGATVTPTVSRHIDFLVKGDAKVAKPGMKEVVAKYHGTRIVSANSFLKFVKGGGAQKVAAAASTASSKGRVRTVVPSRVLKASQAEAEEPMPWEKGSKFHRKTLGIKKAKITRALNAKLKAVQEKKAAKVATAVASAEVTQAVEASNKVEAKVEAPVEAKVDLVEAPSAITLTPSKGLTVQFAGDFADFCRAANQLVVSKQASSATTVVEKLEDQVVEKVEEANSEAPVTPVVVEAKATAKSAGRTRTIVPFKQLSKGQVALKKKTISFTGTFFKAKRAALQKMAKKAGAKVSNGVTEDLALVVVGADAAHKKKLAKKLGVATISEKNFMESCSS